jgi:hypothetical protein
MIKPRIPVPPAESDEQLPQPQSHAAYAACSNQQNCDAENKSRRLHQRPGT